jgi:hypothetical protein
MCLFAHHCGCRPHANTLGHTTFTWPYQDLYSHTLVFTPPLPRPLPGPVLTCTICTCTCSCTFTWTCTPVPMDALPHR